MIVRIPHLGNRPSSYSPSFQKKTKAHFLLFPHAQLPPSTSGRTEKDGNSMENAQNGAWRLEQVASKAACSMQQILGGRRVGKGTSANPGKASATQMRDGQMPANQQTA